MPKFDVVVGNPPFQKNKSKHKLYPKFINKSFELTKINGYVLLISPVPAVDMLLGRTASQVSLKHPFKDIKFVSLGVPKRYFKVGDTFSYFLVKNNDVKESNSLIECYDINDNIINFKTNVRKGSFLPQRNNKIINSIIKKVINNKNEFGRSVSRISDNKENGKTKLIKKLSDNKFEYSYTNNSHKDSDKSKIIFGVSGNKYMIIEEGENIMNGSSACFYILTKNKKESKNIIKFLEDKLVTLIMEKVFNQYQNKFYYASRWFKKPPNLENEYDKNNIYKYFNLTQEEIDYIENSV